jgi:pimeloyl-ACP methyl ester carboxylesterase
MGWPRRFTKEKILITERIGGIFMKTIALRRGFVDTPEGQIHYATVGQGKPVLLLHQTPRSWDEYRDALPIIGRKYWAIAMDTIGFGDSFKPEKKNSVEDYAHGVTF